MLEFNVGELATRLRTSLGVRGRMPLGLDEHVIPCTTVADVTTPPFRRNPVAAQAGFRRVTAGINNQAFIELGFPTLPNVLNSAFSTSSVFVLTGYSVQPLNTVIATGAAVPDNRATVHFMPGNVGAMPFSNAINLVTTERYEVPFNPAVSSYVIPLYLAGYSNVAASVPIENTVGQLAVVQAGVVQPPVWVPCEIALRPGDAIWFVSQHPVSATDGSAIAVVVEGLYYGLG